MGRLALHPQPRAQPRAGWITRTGPATTAGCRWISASSIVRRPTPRQGHGGPLDPSSRCGSPSARTAAGAALPLAEHGSLLRTDLGLPRMGRGSRPIVRWRKDRQRRGKAGRNAARHLEAARAAPRRRSSSRAKPAEVRTGRVRPRPGGVPLRRPPPQHASQQQLDCCMRRCGHGAGSWRRRDSLAGMVEDGPEPLHGGERRRDSAPGCAPPARRSGLRASPRPRRAAHGVRLIAAAGCGGSPATGWL